MSDCRICDGPGCTEKAIVGVTKSLSSLSVDSFITLERPFGYEPLHFHNQECLAKWSLENTRDK